MTTRHSPRISLRSADAGDAATLLALITANLEEGHLLPRTIGELTVHATRFVVAVSADGAYEDALPWYTVGTPTVPTVSVARRPAVAALGKPCTGSAPARLKPRAAWPCPDTITDGIQ